MQKISSTFLLVLFLFLKPAHAGDLGFKIVNLSPDTRTSFSLAQDLNGDGRKDYLITAVEPNGQGHAYVVYGLKKMPSSINLKSLSPNQGFEISGLLLKGEYPSVYAEAVPTTDFNGDGIADIVVNTFSYSLDPLVPDIFIDEARTYVIFAKRGQANIDVSSLNGQNGFMINPGFRSQFIDDTNGDGIADIILRRANAYGNQDPASDIYVVFGQKHGYPNGILDPSQLNLNGRNGFIIHSISPSTKIDISVASDLNKDGRKDYLLTALEPNGDGRVYVLYGSRTHNPSQGFEITGFKRSYNFDQAPNLFAEAYKDKDYSSDFNGDGLADIIVSYNSNFLDPETHHLVEENKTYVIFAKRNQSSLDISSLNGKNGFAIDSGYSRQFSADTNGDGISDLVLRRVTQEGFADYASDVFVVFGQKRGFPSGNLDPAQLHLNGRNGFKIKNLSPDTELQLSLVDGDFSKDGKKDYVFSASDSTGTGHVYVLFGSSNIPAEVDLKTFQFNGRNGFRVDVEIPLTIGYTPFVYGSIYNDFNGDGRADLLVTTDSKQYVIFGRSRSNPFPANFNVSSLNGTNGFAIDSHYAYERIEDVNKDGAGDIILRKADSTRDTSDIYVVYGRRSGWAAVLNPSEILPLAPVPPYPVQAVLEAASERNAVIAQASNQDSRQVPQRAEEQKMIGGREG